MSEPITFVVNLRTNSTKSSIFDSSATSLNCMRSAQVEVKIYPVHVYSDL